LVAKCFALRDLSRTQAGRFLKTISYVG
jgi:hypothetical protein